MSERNNWTITPSESCNGYYWVTSPKGTFSVRLCKPDAEGVVAALNVCEQVLRWASTARTLTCFERRMIADAEKVVTSDLFN
jgi:hypothetical protein